MVSRGSLLPLGVLHEILLLTSGSSRNQENQRFFISSKNIIYVINCMCIIVSLLISIKYTCVNWSDWRGSLWLKWVLLPTSFLIHIAHFSNSYNEELVPTWWKLLYIPLVQVPVSALAHRYLARYPSQTAVMWSGIVWVWRAAWPHRRGVVVDSWRSSPGQRGRGSDHSSVTTESGFHSLKSEKTSI